MRSRAAISLLLRAPACPALILILMLIFPQALLGGDGGAGAGAKISKSTAADSVAVSSQTEALVRAIQERVARIQGSAFKQPVQCEMTTPRGLRNVKREDMDVNLPGARQRDTEFVMRRFGLISGERSLDEVLLDFYGESIVGMYNTTSKRLCLMTQFDLQALAAELVLAHEMCHALQDQRYDLQGLYAQWAVNDDRFLAFSAVIEGDAAQTAAQYNARYIPPERRRSTSVPISTTASQRMAQAPYMLRQEFMFPYRYGPSFVARLKDAKARERVFRAFPRSTEQVMHPEKYFSNKPDEPVAIALDALDKAAPDGWKRRIDNCVGEFSLRSFYEAHQMNDVAKEASEGWGGDRYALYAPEKGNVELSAYALVWRTAWDTEADAAQFLRAMRRAAEVRLMKIKAEREADGVFKMKNNRAAALLKGLGKSVVYIDASSEETARTFLAACGG